MPIGLEDNELLIRCACGTVSHQAMLVHEPDDSRGNNLKGQDDDWYLNVMLEPGSLWDRICKSFRFVFRPRSLRYGMYSEIVLRNQDVEKIADFIVKRRLERKHDLAVAHVAE